MLMKRKLALINLWPVSVPVKGSFVVNMFYLSFSAMAFNVSVPVKGSFVVNC